MNDHSIIDNMPPEYIGGILTHTEFNALINYVRALNYDAMSAVMDIFNELVEEPNVVFKGIGSPTSATPADAAEWDTYLATEPGTVFGVNNVEKGNLLIFNGTVWTKAPFILDGNSLVSRLSELSLSLRLPTSAILHNGESLDDVLSGIVFDTFTTTTNGLVPAPGSAEGHFLRDDGTWASSLSTQGDLISTHPSIIGIINGSNAVVGTGTSIDIKKSSATQDGYLSKEDWAAFYAGSAGAGTVTNVTSFDTSTLVVTNSTSTPVLRIMTNPITNLSDTLATGAQIHSFVLGQNYLTTADISGKEDLLDKGNITVASPLRVAGGTVGAVIGTGVSLNMPKATATTDGYMSKEDVVRLNNTVGGTVRTITSSDNKLSITSDSVDPVITVRPSIIELGNTMLTTGDQVYAYVNGMNLSSFYNDVDFITADDETDPIWNAQKSQYFHKSTDVCTLANLPQEALSRADIYTSENNQIVSDSNEGDIAIRSDINASFVHNGGNTATMADWYTLSLDTYVPVASVNGMIGVVVLTTSDIAEGTNLYYTEARVNANTNVAANSAHRISTYNPHDVTKIQVGLTYVDNTSDANKPVSIATQLALDTKLDKPTTITPGVSSRVTYNEYGLVTGSSTITTDHVTEVTDLRYVTDAQLVILANTSNTNSGDQDITGIDFNAVAISDLQEEQVIQNTAIGLNTAHSLGNGADHAFIDQDVTSGSSPTFDGANITGIVIDHDSLEGLDMDDHPQYHTDGRATVWLAHYHEATYIHANIHPQNLDTGINPGVGDGLVKTDNGVLSTIVDNSIQWDAAVTHTTDTLNPHSVTLQQASTAGATTSVKISYTSDQSFTNELDIPNVKYVNKKMQFYGAWVANEYQPNTVVYDGGWTMISNKVTSDRPSPQPVGDPTFSLPEDPSWTYENATASVYTGTEFTFKTTGWVRTISVFAPVLGADIYYKFLLIDKTDPANHIIRVIQEPMLLEDEWTDIAIGETFIGDGTVYELLVDAYKSSSNTLLAGEWTYSGRSELAPSDRTLNINEAGTLLRIDKNETDGTDQSAFLSNVIPNTNIHIELVGDDTRFHVYSVLSQPTDHGTYITYQISSVENSEIAIDDGSATYVDILVPVTQAVQFVSEFAWWSTNSPTWADVLGKKYIDGVSQSGVDNTAFGIDLQFQRASISTDWDFIASSVGGGGSGGGATTKKYIELEDTPGALTPHALQMVSTDGLTLENKALATIDVGDFNDDGTYATPSDLHSAVTLAGSYDYLTLTGQQITLHQVDYNTDISNVPSAVPTTSNLQVVTNNGNTTTNSIEAASFIGNASSASKWYTPRTLSLSGDASGSVAIDGSADVSLSVAVANDSHTHSFSNITAKPLITYTLNGDVTGSTSIALGNNVTITTAVVNDSHTHNNYLLNTTDTLTGILTITDSLKINGSIISKQENLDVDSAAVEVVASVPHALYNAIFFDYVIKKAGNVRAGTVIAVHDGTDVEFTDTSTKSLGDTSEVFLSADISGADIRLLATSSSDNWTVKSLVRAL